MKLTRKWRRLGVPYRWFAWYPVKTMYNREGNFIVSTTVWLHTVWRIDILGGAFCDSVSVYALNHDDLEKYFNPDYKRQLEKAVRIQTDKNVMKPYWNCLEGERQ